MFVLIIILGENGLGHSPFIRELDDSHVGDYDVSTFCIYEEKKL